MFAIPLLLGITFISFMVIHLAPGDPVEIISGEGIPIDLKPLQDFYKLYGLDQPLHVQYWNWLKRIVRLDFGQSFAPHGRPVIHMIRERLPVTLALNVIEMLIMVVVGGMGSLPGAVLGAALVVGLPELLREIGDYRMPVFGAILIATMLFGEGGLAALCAGVARRLNAAGKRVLASVRPGKKLS